MKVSKSNVEFAINTLRRCKGNPNQQGFESIRLGIKIAIEVLEEKLKEFENGGDI